jgi:hypothetical protein
MIPAMAFAARDVEREPGWGSPRIVGELAKVGTHVVKAPQRRVEVTALPDRALTSR